MHVWHAAPPCCGNADAVPFTVCSLYCSMHCRYYTAKDIGGSSSQAAQQRIVNLYLRAVRLGQEQRSDFWVARCAPPALVHAAASTDVSRASSEAAVAAFRLAQPALKRCKPLIPERWARAVEGLLPQAAAVLPLEETKLRLLQAGGDSSATGATLQAAAQAAHTAQVALLPTAIRAHDVGCHGCGKGAIGLRRCGRCLQAQYCRRVAPGHGGEWAGGVGREQNAENGPVSQSHHPLSPSPCSLHCSRECQKQHWAVHKHECKPTS